MRLGEKTKAREVLIREELFFDDAAVVAHTQQQRQSLMDHCCQPCTDFGRIISLKKTNMQCHIVEAPPIIINTNLETMFCDSHSRDTDIGTLIGQATSIRSRLQRLNWITLRLKYTQITPIFDGKAIITNNTISCGLFKLHFKCSLEITPHLHFRQVRHCEPT